MRGWETGRRRLRAARQAAELRPISADHHRGAVTSSLLTEVYMRLEEYELALQHVDQLLKNPSYMSIKWIEADPLFEPLRDDERLQQLLNEGEYPTLLDEFVDGPPVLGGRVLDRLRERERRGTAAVTPGNGPIPDTGMASTTGCGRPQTIPSDRRACFDRSRSAPFQSFL